MNQTFSLLGLAAWKPVLGGLLLPPVPLLLLVLIGAIALRARRAWGGWAAGLGLVLLWLSGCSGFAQLLTQHVLKPPAALSAARIAAVRVEAARTDPGHGWAIVVLGSGMEPMAPEYRMANLSALSIARLRYGIWLSRQTGAPLLFSGGVGWSQSAGPAEAAVAARIAAQEFGRPLRWTEERSRDTRENAAFSVAELKSAGVAHLLLVTHGWHMPRALRAFEQAAGGSMSIDPAPMELAAPADRPLLQWMPSTHGMTLVRQIARELLGYAAGA